MTQQISASSATPRSGSPEMTTTQTRALLRCGVVGAPLFVVVSLVQAATRDGFDLERHPFSMLSLGEPGWVQIGNFVVSGLLLIVGAVGMRRVLPPGPGRSWGPLLIAGMGASLIGGGVFLADPALGFPPGAPAGSPQTLSWHGAAHAVAFTVGFVSLTAALFVFARRFNARGERGWARYCLATAAAFIPLSITGIATGDFRITTIAIVLGWGWTSLLAARTMTELNHQQQR